MLLDAFFDGYADSRQIFDALRVEIEAIGPAKTRVTKSQIAFHRRINFAIVWIPSRYLRRPAAPLVLTLSFHQRDPSPRWKEIVQPAPGRFTHHLELFSSMDIDDQVNQWLRDAWESAG